MFSIDDSAPQHSLWDWILGVRCSDVEYLYLVSSPILLSVSYLIMVVTSITDMFMSMATSFELPV